MKSNQKTKNKENSCIRCGFLNFKYMSQGESQSSMKLIEAKEKLKFKKLIKTSSSFL